MEPKRHEVIDDIICTMVDVVKKNLPDSNDGLAELIGNEVADRFVDKWKKSTVYIPDDVSYKTQLKRSHIWRDFRQNEPIKRIAFKYKVSIQYVYQVIRDIKAKQPSISKS